MVKGLGCWFSEFSSVDFNLLFLFSAKRASAFRIYSARAEVDSVQYSVVRVTTDSWNVESLKLIFQYILKIFEIVCETVKSICNKDFDKICETTSYYLTVHCILRIEKLRFNQRQEGKKYSLFLQGRRKRGTK